MDVLKYLAVIITAYLVGAVPFGILISRLAKGIDIRRYGSGKIGATNVIRIVGSKAGLISMMLDVAKGSVSVLFAWLLLQTHAAQAAAGAAAVVGHNWPVYIRFKGGRGVAVFVGGLFAMYWPVGLATGAVVLGLGVLTRYMSLGSIVGIAVAIAAMAILVIIEEQPVEYLIYAAAVGCLVLYEHRDNIRRLRAGVELKLRGGSEGGEGAVRGNDADKRGKLETRALSVVQTRGRGVRGLPARPVETSPCFSSLSWTCPGSGPDPGAAGAVPH